MTEQLTLDSSLRKKIWAENNEQSRGTDTKK